MERQIALEKRVAFLENLLSVSSSDSESEKEEVKIKEPRELYTKENIKVTNKYIKSKLSKKLPSKSRGDSKAQPL